MFFYSQWNVSGQDVKRFEMSSCIWAWLFCFGNLLEKNFKSLLQIEWCLQPGSQNEHTCHGPESNPQHLDGPISDQLQPACGAVSERANAGGVSY